MDKTMDKGCGKIIGGREISATPEEVSRAREQAFVMLREEDSCPSYIAESAVRQLAKM